MTTASATNGRNAAVKLQGLSKTYPGAQVPAVNELSLDVEDGEVYTLLGPSGCGKTTTLRMVAGLEVPDEGDIYFGEREVVVTSKRFRLPPDKRDLGMVFQSYAIWPHMTVEENVAFPLATRHMRRAEIRERVAHVLDLVNLPGLQKRPAPLLSGGQQQRVALARALVIEPKVLLLDEPFSNLDAKLREQMRIELKLLQKRLNIAVLFVTHDQIEALSLSNRIALMNLGILQQQGPPQLLYEEPANEFVRDFIGKTVLLRGKVQSSNPSGQVSVAIDGGPNCVIFGRSYNPDGLSTGQDVYTAIRPEDIEVQPMSGNDIPSGAIGGAVSAALFTGERFEYQVEVDGQGTLQVFGERHNPASEGNKVTLTLRPDGHSVWSSDWTHTDTDAAD
ncbi:MAG: ABC transporter ATP-binding protein [Chloroflexota bacterium]|nr:ABC transporter ATP-binding protein [Chloroflexota bacterium]MDE2885913.1 ABC transporter ATP-binding protein [Chloroflexota bacterium]